MWPILGVLIFP